MISKEFGMPCTAGTVYEDEWGNKYIEPEELKGV